MLFHLPSSLLLHSSLSNYPLLSISYLVSQIIHLYDWSLFTSKPNIFINQSHYQYLSNCISFPYTSIAIDFEYDFPHGSYIYLFDICLYITIP
jgi:hypothetical protein